MPNLRITKNNYNYYINFTVNQRSIDDPGISSSLALTSATVYFKVASINNLTSLVVNGTCTITDPTNGICKYLVQSGDFTTAGTYKAELEIHLGTPTVALPIITANNIIIYVETNLG